MKLCPIEQDCAFTHCDEKYKLLPAMEVYETKYCNGSDASECIRFKLSDKFGKLQVPSNMMPNGLPLPGTHRRDWTTVALQYKRYVENKDG